MTKIDTANINSVWGSLIIEELVRNGVDYFCISPGSRSTPLVAAIASHEKTRSMIHFDERGTAFHALGYARATGRPAAVVCTSGTAVANLLPAVVEASMDMVPMILLTADRPPELRDAGANQTIRQARIFSDYPRYACELPCPDIQISPQTLLTIIDQSVYRAMSSPCGPVHVNCMFREPLAPTPTGESFDQYLRPVVPWMDSSQPFTEYHQAEKPLPATDLARLSELLKAATHGVMVIGRLHTEADQRSAMELSRALRWPTFPDILSGLRLGTDQEQIIHHFDLLLSSKEFSEAYRPKVCLHIGDQVTSKRLLKYLEESAPTYIHITDHPMRHDPMHLVTQRFDTSIDSTCTSLARYVTSGRDAGWLSAFRDANDSVGQLVCTKLSSCTALSEPSAAFALSNHVDGGSLLFVASSMPIRDMDSMAAPHGPGAAVIANRGASGIDGTIASAAGYAAGANRPVTLLIGDLALLHDLNSLAMLRTLSDPITIVVINNNGGGIFSSLPIAEHKGIFERFFATPHNLQFHDAAAQFGLHYHCPHDIPSFIETLNHAKSGRRSLIIELLVDRERNLAFHHEIVAAVSAQLEGA
jgi:2-succinyl-5-enolpyruvyl-6-hydroxy-3-cyclohexene-1-carboxylate synthase